MVSGLMERHYRHVTRYTTSSFLRVKLGEALAGHRVLPGIYATAEEARQGLQDEATF
jgi:propionate CoA-transferase